MNKWLLYNLTVGFTVYWLSNLILWFPWSVNATLGMSLMLTVSPVIWFFSSFLCIRTYPGKNSMVAAAYNSLIFLVLAVIMDYIFFGLIRKAMEDLYHPTTFYGYGFVACLPFIVVLAFKKRIEKQKRESYPSDFIKAGLIGFVCFSLLTMIILFDIQV
ncbi:hypothetical protein J1N10_01170 [Carboxylicivirga sp. A043]|uniref:hypothetical protein n=1 Tax=Carboxylicivirga litoralis TaxID=2816963 RepID=UPI0021CAF518|nr:hypothetical protein [Carboxylicivirga sp. A043]MCU4154565.1 hypothetical protein [Carboxylicivirga sp. A043]